MAAASHNMGNDQSGGARGGGGGAGPSARANAASASAAANAAQDLSKKLKLLEKREKHVENQINKLTQQAKERKKKGDKKGALFCLKKRKLLQGQIDKLQAARLNLETMQLTIGSANMNREILTGMQTGAAALGQIHQNMDVDAVDDIRDRMEEQMDVANEISDAIATPMGDGLDDDDVLDELAEIEAEEERERLAAAAARNPGRVATADAGRDILASALDLPSAPTTPILPSAPTGAVLPDAPTGRVAIAADDPDLAELEAMAAGMT